jgi:hypothetical protein
MTFCYRWHHCYVPLCFSEPNSIPHSSFPSQVTVVQSWHVGIVLVASAAVNFQLKAELPSCNNQVPANAAVETSTI